MFYVAKAGDELRPGFYLERLDDGTRRVGVIVAIPTPWKRDFSRNFGRDTTRDFVVPWFLAEMTLPTKSRWTRNREVHIGSLRVSWGAEPFADIFPTNLKKEPQA